MEAQKELLFLAHRIPYPPNKGDKIRSFNLLKYLARNYRVHLGAFIDTPHDWDYRADVEALCGEVCLLNLQPLRRRIASLKGLVDGRPLTLPYYAHDEMQRWVDDIVTRRPLAAIVVFSSPMAQYVERHDRAGLRRVVDFVDVDSDKWRQYTKSKSWPLSWLYGREGRTLLDYERKIAAGFDATVFVSDDEAALFQRLAPETSGRVSAVHNGVDTDYFSPLRDYTNPYPPSSQVLVFTGAMDYWANVDAVRWFAEDIFPGIRAQIPTAEFFIVGARPSTDVTALDKLSGVTVTGAVHDIRPYIAHAGAAVAPMRIARGVQNKVLEAMAMGKPVLATPEAAAGITASLGVDLVVEADVAGLQAQAVRLLTEGNMAMEQAARSCILRHYGWEQNLKRFDELLGAEVENGDPASPGRDAGGSEQSGAVVR